MTANEWYCALLNRWIGYAIESNVKRVESLCMPHKEHV
jgi:hypothetical protein